MEATDEVSEMLCDWLTRPGQNAESTSGGSPNPFKLLGFSLSRLMP